MMADGDDIVMRLGVEWTHYGVIRQQDCPPSSLGRVWRETLQLL